MAKIGRRDFLRSSLGAAAALGAVSPGKSVSASDKVLLGIMGCGGRGTQLAQWLTTLPEVEIAYLCDVNERMFDRILELVEERQERSPKLVTDFRRILEDPQVDGLVNATPDHWHSVGTVLACQAGKDVYCEKPLAINIWEGWKMVEAARRYDRVVQAGTQTRSSEYPHKAAEYIRQGNLGEVHFTRVLNLTPYPGGPKGPEEPVPQGLDWDMWCGPSPLAPYSPGRWWYNWWEFGGGNIAGETIHQIDLARLVLGLDYSDSAYHAGGIFYFQDERTIPDTQIATFEFGKLVMALEGALWTPYMKKIPGNIRDGDGFPDWPFTSTRVEVYGSEGFMYLGRQGGGWQAFDKEGVLVRSEPGRQGDMAHLRNFIDCIRTREKPAADVEEAHKSSLLCHLANVSYRVGNRKVKFDPQSQSFPGDEQANSFLRRKQREPWVIPDKV